MEKPNELNQAFTELLHSPNSQRNVMFRIVAGIVPALNYVVRTLPLLTAVNCMNGGLAVSRAE
jgi:hypothetical protein